MSEEERGALKPFPVDESFYYTTKYGSPLAYARPIDLLGENGLEDVSGLKVLDFGYGTVGHLRLLAGLGADVTGIDVNPLLRVLYSTPEDQGIIKNPKGRDGRLRLIDGRFPADQTVRTAVGGNYDLILSKNTLKRGYVHPERPVNPRRLLNLRVDDAEFVKSLHDALKPGGRVMIYNITPAPSPPGQPYKHWADGRCAFARDVWVAAGFRIVCLRPRRLRRDPSHGPRPRLGPRRIRHGPEERPVREVLVDGEAGASVTRTRPLTGRRPPLRARLP